MSVLRTSVDDLLAHTSEGATKTHDNKEIQQ